MLEDGSSEGRKVGRSEGQRDRGTEGRRDRGTEGQRDRGTVKTPQIKRRGLKTRVYQGKNTICAITNTNQTITLSQIPLLPSYYSLLEG